MRVAPEEYLATSYRPDCDYVDGEVVERNVGEWDHSRLRGLITRYLMSREQQWGFLVAPEQRVQVKTTRFRIPDIAVLSGAPDGQILRKPPFLCIELRSPRDRLNDMRARVDEYLDFGVNYVWVIDANTRRAWIYTPEGEREVKDGLLTTESPDIQVPLFNL